MREIPVEHVCANKDSEGEPSPYWPYRTERAIRRHKPVIEPEKSAWRLRIRLQHGKGQALGR